MAKLDTFKQEFCQRVEQIPGVNWVEFIGSAASGNYVPGRSDLDVFVHGHKIPKQSKMQIIALLKELNTKHEMGLEGAPCQHPTPFFIDTRLSKALYGLLKGRLEAGLPRSVFKRIAPSYGFVWRLHEKRLRVIHMRR